MKFKFLMIMLVLIVLGCSSSRVSVLEDRLDRLEARVDINEDWLFFIENEVMTRDAENK